MTANLALATVGCSSDDPAEDTPSCVGGTWTMLEPMNERREYPAPITLADGRLLAVSGHYLEDGPLSSAELFDPATRRWTWTGSLHNPRQGGGGTLLHDGRVLVGDSFGSPDHFPSETYDPSTGEWVIAARMNADRQNYTMTLLEVGSVLITGGIDWATEETLATSEIYDPSSDSWTLTAPLDQPRFGHRGVRLRDGRVLVIGGSVYPQAFAEPVSCQIYDPESGTWAPASSMQRTYAVTGIAALADGTVLALGLGQAENPFHDPLIEGTAEIYDPSLDTWRPAAPMLQPRLGYALVTLTDQRILAIGGTIANQEELAASEIYDPRRDAWTEIEPMTGARHPGSFGSPEPTPARLASLTNDCRTAGALVRATPRLIAPLTPGPGIRAPSNSEHFACGQHRCARSCCRRRRSAHHSARSTWLSPPCVRAALLSADSASGRSKRRSERRRRSAR